MLHCEEIANEQGFHILETIIKEHILNENIHYSVSFCKLEFNPDRCGWPFVLDLLYYAEGKTLEEAKGKLAENYALGFKIGD